MKPNFFHALKEKMTKEPSRKVDQFILKRASDHFEQKYKSHVPWWSIFAGTTVAALGLVLWLQVSENTTSNSKASAMLTESPELLKEMDDVELLVEVSQYSDEEWNIVMNGES